MNLFQRASGAIGRLAAGFAFPGRHGNTRGPNLMRVLLPGTHRDYARLVGDPWANSAVYNCLRFVMTNITEPRLKVVRTRGKGKDNEVLDHPLAKLLRRPNGEYPGKTLLKATALSYNINGNAYWLIQRDNLGRPARLWWLPHWTVWAQWPDDGTQFISHYCYRPDGFGKVYDVPKEDLVHFRNGIDPRNMRYGLAPIAAILREVFGDNEASNLEASLVHNCAIPGLVFSPGADVKISPQGAEDLRKQLEENYSGDKIGRPLAPPFKVDVHRISLTPQELSLREVRIGKEERIAGAFGLPPILASLGAGLDKSTYSNYETAERIGFNNNIVPTLEDWAETMDDDLLPQWDVADVLDLVWDFAKVRCLQEDENEAAKRHREDFKYGITTRAEARTARGYEPVEGRDDVFSETAKTKPANEQEDDPDDADADAEK